MLKECNFKYDRELDSYTTKQKWKHCYIKDSNCDGEDDCILYQIYERLDIIELVRGHEKTLNALAGK